MITFNQLFCFKRIRKKRTDRKRALEKCPQKKGSCIRVYKASPKKCMCCNGILNEKSNMEFNCGHQYHKYCLGDNEKQCPILTCSN